MGKPQTERDAFDHGYLICLSNLINSHGSGTEAEGLMQTIGVTRYRIDQLGFDDYDRLPLQKLRRELDERERKSRAFRNSRNSTPNPPLHKSQENNDA